jgi:signal peptidase I
MVRFFDFADGLNKSRHSVENPQNSLPDFMLSIYGFIKGFIKFWFYYTFVLSSLFFRITIVASGSMTPVTQSNEIVLSSQLGYGIKLSKILPIQIEKESIIDKIFWKYEDPKIGDVVSFTVPLVDNDSVYTKRILGVAGDTVQFKNGVVFINKQPAELKFKCKYTYVEFQKTIHGSIYEETLPNGVVHDVLYISNPGSGHLDNTAEFKVPEGHVFCCGDNRHNSDDSRSLFGFVAKRHVSGKVMMILFSNGNLTSANIKKFMSGIRWDRCIKWMI